MKARSAKHRGVCVLRVQRRVQRRVRKVILTRADLPTPPEPNTTSLYSRMVGSFPQTAKQSALDKRKKTRMRKLQKNAAQNNNKKNTTNQTPTVGKLTLRQNKRVFSSLASEFSHS